LFCVAVLGACGGGDEDSAQSLPADDGDGGGEDSGEGNGGGDNGGGDNGGGDNGGGGAPGVPGGGSGGGAAGAPIDIPPLTELSGLTVQRVTEIMEEKIRAACGGDLCLVVETAVQGDGETNCEYGGEPPEGTPVERGSTLVITAVCEDDSEGETGGEGETDTGTETDTETDTGGEAETQSTP
jgi:hypothetical protein